MEDALIEVTLRAPYDALNSLLRTCKRMSDVIDPLTFLHRCSVPAGMQFPNGMRHGIWTMGPCAVMYDFGRPVDWIYYDLYRYGTDMRVMHVSESKCVALEYNPIKHGQRQCGWRPTHTIDAQRCEPISRLQSTNVAAKLEIVREWYRQQTWPIPTGGVNARAVLHEYLLEFPELE